MVALAGLGVLRSLVVLLHLNDAGLTRGLARSSAGLSALTRATGATNNSMFALQNQMTIVGAVVVASVAAMGAAFAGFERQIALASIATGKGVTQMGRLGESSLTLSKLLARSPTDVAKLRKEIEFFGIRSEASASKIAEFSTRLGILAEESPEKIAQNLVRLLVITKRTGETVDEAALRFDALAATVFNVGRKTVSGTAELLKFIESMQAVGAVSTLTEGQIVAISGAIADLTPNLREMATSAVQRVFLTENFNELARALGTSTDEVKRMRKEDPVGFLISIVEVLNEAGEQDKLKSLMKDLDLGQIRSAKGFAALQKNLVRFRDLLKETEDPQGDINRLMEDSDAILRTLSGRWERFTSSIHRFAVTAGGMLQVVLVPLLVVLTALFDLLASNKALAAVAVFGGLALGIRHIQTSLLAMGGLSTALGLSGFIGGARTGFAVGRVGALSALTSGSNVLFSGPTTRLQRLQGAGGGLLGLIPGIGAGLGGRLAGSLPGRFALGAGPIGLAVGLFAMMAPLFQSIGSALADMGREGGLAGVVLKMLALLFKVLETGANLLNKAFSLIFDGIMGFINLLGKALGVDILGGINAGLENLNTQFDALNANLTGTPASPTATGLTQNFNVQTREGGDNARMTLRDTAARAAFSVRRNAIAAGAG